MKNIWKIAGIFLIVLGSFIPCVSATVLSLDPQEIKLDPGSVQKFQLTADTFPDGLAGYRVTASIADPEIAEVTNVSFPDWAVLNDKSDLPAGSCLFSAVDLQDNIKEGDSNVRLGTIEVREIKPGTTELSILIEQVDADNGNLIPCEDIKAKITTEGSGAETEENTEERSEENTETKSETSSEAGGFGCFLAVAVLITSVVIKRGKHL